MMHLLTTPQNHYHGDNEISVETIEKFLSENKEKPEIKSILKKLVPLDEETVKGFLESDESGKKLAQKLFDQRVTNAVKKFEENFKAEKLPKLVEEMYLKKHPEETPEQRANRELIEKVNRLEQENKRAKQKELALELINEAKLPFAKIVDKFIGENDEETASKIQAFKEIWDSSVSEAVKKAMAEQSGRKPSDSDSNVSNKATLEKQYEVAKQQGNILEMVRLKNLIYKENLKKAQIETNI